MGSGKLLGAPSTSPAFLGQLWDLAGGIRTADKLELSWDAAAMGAWHSPEVQNEARGAPGGAGPPRNKVLPCFMLWPGTHPASSGAALLIFEARRSPATPFPIGFKPCFCTKGRVCTKLLGSHAGPPGLLQTEGRASAGLPLFCGSCVVLAVLKEAIVKLFNSCLLKSDHSVVKVKVFEIFITRLHGRGMKNKCETNLQPRLISLCVVTAAGGVGGRQHKSLHPSWDSQPQVASSSSKHLTGSFLP